MHRADGWQAVLASTLRPLACARRSCTTLGRMGTVRAITRVLLSLMAGMALLFGLFSLDTSLVQQTIINSREIESSFTRAAAYVDQHIVEKGAPPTFEEFKAWSKGFSPQPYSIRGISLDLPPYSPEFTTEHGQPPKNGYVLSYWRGEWMEDYISWKKKSSLVFEPAAYFMFGSSWAQAAAGISLALLLVASTFKLRSRT